MQIGFREYNKPLDIKTCCNDFDMPPEDCSAQVTEKKIEGMLLFAAGLKKSPVGS